MHASTVLVCPVALVFLFTSHVSCEEKETFELVYQNDNINAFLFVFGVLFVATTIRHFILSTNTSVPYGILITLMGNAYGLGSLYSSEMEDAIQGLLTVGVEYMKLVGLPLVLFSTAFCLDVHTFMKSLSQILVLSFPVALLAAFTTGQLMRQMVDKSWNSSHALLLGVMQIPIYPGTVLRWLRDNSVHTKYILILIKGEICVSAAVGVYAFNLLTYHLQGWVVEWYQFVFGVMRWIFLGLPLGYCFGLVSTFLMKFAYNEATNLALLTLSMCFMSFYLGEYIANSGIITCMVTALSMGRERPALLKEVEEELVNFWKTFDALIFIFYMGFVGVVIPRQLTGGEFTTHMYFVVFVTYLMTIILRFCFSLLFSPILSRLGYGISFRSLIICAWAGIKSPLCIYLASAFVKMDDSSAISTTFFLHTSVLYTLMLLINATFMPVLLKALGLFDISNSKQMNMTNCMKYLYETRARLLTMMKMDRLLSDANWPLVMNYTVLRHPYRSMIETEDHVEEDENEEDEDYFMRYKFTFCPDCQRHVPKEPTMREMKEMTKEAKLRLLKHKKTVYSRQYENGMVSKEGARTLHQAVELAMDNEKLVIEVDGLLKMFSTEGQCLQSLEKRMVSILTTKEEIIKIPRKKWRKWCYRVFNNALYIMFIYTVIALNIIFLNLNLMVPNEDLHFALLFIFSFFLTTYLMDFCVKVTAFSYNHVWRDGVKTYFKSIWRVLEFLIVIFNAIMLVVHVSLEIWEDSISSKIYYLDAAVSILMLIRLFRILNFLDIYKYCRKLGNKLSKRLSAETDRSKALAYELGKSYIAGEDEILESLQQIVDNDTIREKLRGVTERDRLAVARRLGMAELETPRITSAVKTKTAIRSVLKSMKDDIHDLKVAGWVDDVECHKLLHSLSEKYKEVYSVQFVEPSPPKMILREIMYMNSNDELVEFFFSNVSMRKYDPGNAVIQEGEVVDGVFILITGMFKVTYAPKRETIAKMTELGAVPVVDHICPTSLEKPLMEYVMPGNSFGELSTITDRPYEGTVTAETYSEVFLLKNDVVLKGLAMDPDPVTGLKSRIWKKIAFRIATSVLLGIPSYHSYTQEKIKLIVEKAFMPDLETYKVFAVNDDMIQDIILIEGRVIGANTRDVYKGPCYIPRAIQKLLLPASSLTNIGNVIETKIMVIPKKDITLSGIQLMRCFK